MAIQTGEFVGKSIVTTKEKSGVQQTGAVTDARKTMYKGRVFSVYEEDVVYPEGKSHRVSVVEHSPSAVILPITKEGRIVLLKQFRGPYKKRIVELPAGKVDEGEKPEEAAARELKEETGYATTDTRLMFHSLASPGYVKEEFYCYLIRCGERGETAREPSEQSLQMVEVSLADALLMVRNNIIEDSKTRDAILYYYTFIASEGRPPHGIGNRK